MAKIALDLERALAQRAANGHPGGQSARTLARGDGWLVEDVLCTCGPRDRVFDEQHWSVSIAIVVAGTFEYRADSRWTRGSELMTPGSLLLGNPGQRFVCEHAHAAGDRCISFHYSPAYFETLAADAGVRGSSRFCLVRMPPVRALASVVARSCARLVQSAPLSWEELGVELAANALHAAAGIAPRRRDPSSEAIARVTALVRAIDRQPDVELPLAALARSTGLSPYHVLRTFARVTGATPHQYLLRARLRRAALQLATEPARIIDVALRSGFGDVSNFNRTFRAEFGLAPRAFRVRHGAAAIEPR